MNISMKSLFLIATVLSLSGCVGDDFTTGAIDTAAPATHGSERYPISVVKGPQMMVIDSRKGHLSDEQEQALRAFVHQAQSAGVTPMTISRPATSSGPAFQITGEIVQVMEEQGLPRSRMAFETYSGKTNGVVKIAFVSTYAKTKNCGDWRTDMTNTNSNESYANLGCAVQSNIAAEIANPETLIVPKTPPLKDSTPDVAAVQRSGNYVNEVTLPTNYDYAN